MTNIPRIPVHVVYGGAHLFRSGTAGRLGSLALEALDAYAPTAATFAQVFKLPPTRTREVYRRLTEKLRSEPVEDYRIDFEDGFGRRTNDEEDRTARSAAGETAAGMAAGTLPPMMGIRIKPLALPASQVRAFRTLEIYLETLAGATSGKLPADFVVTIPKLTSAAEVAACAETLDRLEARLGLTSRIGIELMAETPQALMGPDGQCPIPSFISAAQGRCVAVHFGPYDYTAALGIVGAEQRLDHPACDAARALIQLACAGTGVRISDGPVNILPLPPRRATARLNAKQTRENRLAIHDLWRINYALVARSLRHGFYQGWDLHPAQLPVRFTAVYAFFLEHLEAQARRLRSIADDATGTSVVGSVFDDAATAQGILNFFRTGISCGALSADDLAAVGVGPRSLGDASSGNHLRRR
jgi:citrate lyase beta subunit